MNVRVLWAILSTFCVGRFCSFSFHHDVFTQAKKILSISLCLAPRVEIARVGLEPAWRDPGDAVLSVCLQRSASERCCDWSENECASSMGNCKRILRGIIISFSLYHYVFTRAKKNTSSWRQLETAGDGMNPVWRRHRPRLETEPCLQIILQKTSHERCWCRSETQCTWPVSNCKQILRGRMFIIITLSRSFHWNKSVLL